MGQRDERRVATLLEDLGRGDNTALPELFSLVYEELKVLAARQRHSWHGDLTLNTTALVHEAYLKLVAQKRLGASSRAHFFAVAAKAIRHILCNYARDRRRQKRGGDIERIPLQELDAPSGGFVLSESRCETIMSLDAALGELERMDPGLGAVVECRFFAGMSIEDTAAALGCSPATVKRQWSLARAWLYHRLEGVGEGPPAGGHASSS